MSKKTLLAITLSLSVTGSFAAVQVIPKAEQDLRFIKANKSVVVKNAKGTHLQASLDALMSLTPDNWFNLSPANGAEGVRTEETYLIFPRPELEEVIVAVIDSGVDVNHEDLQGKIWINEDEVANDGLDNDGNGYVDDVFGWNFIGGSNGMASIVEDTTIENGIRLIKGASAAQINADTLEITREFIRMKKLKERVEDLGETLTPAQAEYLTTISKTIYETVENAKRVIATYDKRLETYKRSEAILLTAGVESITLENVRALESTDPNVLKAKADMLGLLANGIDLARIQRILDYYGDQLKYFYNESFDPRSIVGDNYANQSERFYGNNDVIGPDSSHGTHVAGIIAASRDNGIGIKGVAAKVKVMAIRVVPNGDERDKDVANGIRYAVDNGAKIINMSFGKAYSPFKRVVDEAVRYAESKGVLMVHAAGNSNQNNDSQPNFPNRLDRARGEEFNNWLEIGASSFEKGLNLPADFSNYGKKSVDFFAPGVDIFSTTPDNSYDTYSGTSMAAPTAAGVAALVLSFEKKFEASSLRSLLIDTSRRYPNLRVHLPGTENSVLFSSLSRTGTIIDAFEAIKAIQ